MDWSPTLIHMGMLLAHIPFLPLLSKVSQSVLSPDKFSRIHKKTGCAFAQPVYLLSRFSVIAESAFSPEMSFITESHNTSLPDVCKSSVFFHLFPLLLCIYFEKTFTHPVSQNRFILTLL